MQNHAVVHYTASAESYRRQQYCQYRKIPLSTVLTVQIHTVVNCTASAESYQQQYCTPSGDLYRQLYFQIPTVSYRQCRIISLSTVLPVMNLTENSTSTMPATVLSLEIHTNDCTASEDSYQHLCCQRRSVEDVSTVTARLQRQLQLLSQCVAEASSGDVDCSGSFYF